jgi:hypothetical protein
LTSRKTTLSALSILIFFVNGNYAIERKRDGIEEYHIPIK